MRDWSDNVLDDRIATALRLQATVTPQQKQQAWAAVLEKASAQTVLPAAVIEPARPRVRERAKGWLGVVTRGAVWLLMDETCYDRALRHRRNAFAFVLEMPLRNLVGGIAT